MFKIKLLILLLINLVFISCANNYNNSQLKLAVSYIGGEYDGLVLSNHLKRHLNNFGMLDKNSNYQINGSISHSSDLFITNIDNTSDREKVLSSIDLKVYDLDKDCIIFSYLENVSQFYILASGDKFTSNKKAIEEIRDKNTDYFVKKFINKLYEIDIACQNE